MQYPILEDNSPKNHAAALGDFPCHSTASSTLEPKTPTAQLAKDVQSTANMQAQPGTMDVFEVAPTSTDRIIEGTIDLLWNPNGCDLLPVAGNEACGLVHEDPLPIRTELKGIGSRSTANHCFALLLKEDAFDIYSSLLSAEDGGMPMTPRRLITPLLACCMRSAESQLQHRIMEGILLNRLRDFQRGRAGSAELFMAHAFLAQSCSRQGNLFDASFHRAEASEMVCTFGSGKDMDESLDILLYIQHCRFESPNLEVDLAVAYDEIEKSQPVQDVNYDNLVSFIMNHRYPELRLASYLRGFTPRLSADLIPTYVRSCLSWCETARRGIKPPRMDRFWRDMPTRSAEPCGQWAETIALFATLWDEQCGNGTLDSCGWFWMRDPEDKIGISAEEVLSICCQLANGAAPWSSAISEESLWERFSDGLEGIRSKSDQDIASRFLQVLYVRSILARRSPSNVGFYRFARSIDSPPEPTQPSSSAGLQGPRDTESTPPLGQRHNNMASPGYVNPAPTWLSILNWQAPLQLSDGGEIAHPP